MNLTPEQQRRSDAGEDDDDDEMGTGMCGKGGTLESKLMMKTMIEKTIRDDKQKKDTPAVEQDKTTFSVMCSR